MLKSELRISADNNNYRKKNENKKKSDKEREREKKTHQRNRQSTTVNIDECVERRHDDKTEKKAFTLRCPNKNVPSLYYPT